jgi:hypothetical protein
MDFPRIDSALATCEAHLADLNDDDPRAIEVESYLVGSLVLMIVSEYEEAIEALFSLRAAQCGDAHVIKYVQGQIAQKFRSPDLSKINETLGRFGSDYKAAFLATVDNTPLHAAWDKVLIARHAVVHKKGSLNLTLRELKEAYPQTLEVLKTLSRVLGCP